MIPAQCPECGTVQQLAVKELPPWKHSHGEEWETKLVCHNCERYEKWVDS